MQESLVLPVLDGLPLLNAWCSAPLAFSAIQNHLKSLLVAEAELTECDGSRHTLQDAIASQSEGADAVLTDALLEDLVVRACFVTTAERAEKLTRPNSMIEPPQSVDCPLRDGRILHLPGSLRERATEVLFQVTATVSMMLKYSLYDFHIVFFVAGQRSREHCNCLPEFAVTQSSGRPTTPGRCSSAHRWMCAHTWLCGTSAGGTDAAGGCFSAVRTTLRTDVQVPHHPCAAQLRMLARCRHSRCTGGASGA